MKEKKYFNKKVVIGKKNVAILRGLAHDKNIKIETLIKNIIKRMLGVSLKGAFATSDSIILESRTKTQHDAILENIYRIEPYFAQITNRANKNQKFLQIKEN